MTIRARVTHTIFEPTRAKPKLSSTAFVALFAGLVASCGNSNTGVDPLLTTLAPQDQTDSAGKFIDPAGNDVGYVVFTNSPNGAVLMRVDIKDLPQGWHGIHLHQVGDCSDGAEGFKKSGGHIDPDENAHGLLNPEGSERADIPNIYAHSDGRVTAEIYRTGVSLYPSEANAAANGPYPLLDEDGFAVIIHENRDDHQSQPIGGAGRRIACAVLDG